jgi:hypothetical protein
VKAIGNLGRCRGTGSSPAGIVLGPVTGNDFNPGMLAQPRGHDLGRAFRQELDRPMLLEID